MHAAKKPGKNWFVIVHYFYDPPLLDLPKLDCDIICRCQLLPLPWFPLVFLINCQPRGYLKQFLRMSAFTSLIEFGSLRQYTTSRTWFFLFPCPYRGNLVPWLLPLTQNLRDSMPSVSVFICIPFSCAVRLLWYLKAFQRVFDWLWGKGIRQTSALNQRVPHALGLQSAAYWAIGWYGLISGVLLFSFSPLLHVAVVFISSVVQSDAFCLLSLSLSLSLDPPS